MASSPSRSLAARATDGASPDASGGGGESDCTVAVSWNNFQQPRWAAKDKPNIQETVEAGGGTYTDADANLDTEQQLTDIETFINQGADVLILLAQNNEAVLPGRRGCQGMPAFRSSRTTA